jgi:hypothetical protein
MRRAAKVDENQPKIVQALRRIGCTVLITSQLKNAFDILVGFQGRLFIMEIKDGDKPPSARKLSEGEQKCKADFERVNVPYYVVNSVEDAVDVVTGKGSN